MSGRSTGLRGLLAILAFLAPGATASLGATEAPANGGGQTLFVNKYSPNASSTPGCASAPFTEIGSANPSFTFGAVGAANSGDTIFICGSPDADLDPYEPNGVVAGVPVGAKNLTFAGDGPGLTIVDGESSRTPFYASSAVNPGAYLNFRSMTVRNGQDASNGGGVEALDRVVDVEDAEFIDNTALGGDGGAIIAGQVVMTDSTFRGNSAPDGVAGAVASYGGITVQASALVGNSARVWGGSLSAGAGVAITDSTFTDNTVSDPSGSGGAIYTQFGPSPSTVERSTFTGNSAASFAGAIRVFGNTLEVTNSTFAGNEAPEAPVVQSSDDVRLAGVTVSANVGPRDITTLGSLEIGSSIIDETGETCVAAANKENLGGNAISDMTAPTGDCNPFVGGGGGPATRVDPATIELQPLADNGGPTETLALGFGSVARDSGSPLTGNCLGADQRGLLRPPADCSSGAYQLTTELLTVSKTGQGTGTVDSSPAGIGCGPNCLTETSEFARRPPFTTVTLSATPAPGSLFTGWSGDCFGTAATCQVGLDQAREVTADFMIEPPPTPGNPRLRVSVFTPGKVRAGRSFSARVTVANQAQPGNDSLRANGNGSTTATRLRACLKLPDGVLPVRAKGAKVRGRTLCWSKTSLSAGRTVSYVARLKATRSAGRSQARRSATLRASVTASNVDGGTFEASGRKRVRIAPARPRPPEPPTG